MKTSSIQAKISALALVIFLVSGCARNQQAVHQSASSLENEVGSAIHQQILQTVPVYSEKSLNDYVQNVGYKVAAQADRKMDYRFVLLEDERVYSTFAPGGYVYVTTGFFQFLQSEIELAGILAYEIAALQYKDPRLSRLKKTFNLMLQTGSYVAPAFGAIGALSVIGLALVSAATDEKSLLSRVRAADKRALQYLFKSGYDPQGLINPLYRMSDFRSPHRAYLYDYLQSHPIDLIRLSQLNAQFLKLPLENKEFDAERNQYLKNTEMIRSTFARK